MLAEVLKDDLIRHLSEIRSIYDKDRREEINGVWLVARLLFLKRFLINVPCPEDTFEP